MLTSVMLAVAAGASVAAVLAGVARALGGKPGGWVGASAVGSGYVAGHLVFAWPAIPPVDVTDRIPWLALAAVLVAVFEAGRTPRPWTRWVGRSVLAALVLGAMLGPVAGAPGMLRVWLIPGLVALLAWADVEVLAARCALADVLRALLITAGGTTVALVFAGSAVLPFLCAVLTAALAGGWLVVVRDGPPRGWVTVALAVLTALVLDGSIYAFLPVPTALLLAAAPAMTWLTRLGPARRLGRWPALAFGTVSVLIPIAIAIAVAVALTPSLDS